MCNLYLWDVTFVIVRCDICICIVDTQPTYTGHHAPASRRCVLHNETQTVTVEYPWWWSCWFWSSSLADSRTSSFFVQYQQKKWYVCRIFWMNFCFQTERLWENKWLTKPSNWESANPLQNCVPRPLIPLFRNSLYSRGVSVFSTPLYFFAFKPLTFVKSLPDLFSLGCLSALPCPHPLPALLWSTSAGIPKAWS